jgi:hypothetical protein
MVLPDTQPLAVSTFWQPMTSYRPKAFDPVAKAVEKHLLSLEGNGTVELQVREDGDEIHLCFGEGRAHGKTYDIALIRLAGDLLSDPELSAALMAALRSHMPGAL